MGEFKNNMRYAKTVGADISKPKIDRRSTSQRVTDEMNEMRNRVKWAQEAYENLLGDYMKLKRANDHIKVIVFDVFAYRLGPDEWDEAQHELIQRLKGE